MAMRCQVLADSEPRPNGPYIQLARYIRHIIDVVAYKARYDWLLNTGQCPVHGDAHTTDFAAMTNFLQGKTNAYLPRSAMPYAL